MTNKNIVKSLMVVTLISAMIMPAIGCQRGAEAVISDGEDITEELKQHEILGESNSAKFSYDDLKAAGIVYKMTEAEVKNTLGEPKSIMDPKVGLSQQQAENAGNQEGQLGANLDEMVYVYDNLRVTFAKIDGEYKVTSVYSNSPDVTFARGLKVGNTFDDILNVYYRDVDCLNNYYFSEDKISILGNFLYGGFTMDSFDKMKLNSKVEYGVINYNGYLNREAAEEYFVEFTYFAPPYIDGYVSVMDEFAQIAIDLDKNSKITAIRWYYYPRA